MSSRTFVRGMTVGGVLFCALGAGVGVASAAYLGPDGGVTTSGGGTASFSASGFDPGSSVTIVVTSCGVSHTSTVTAAADGSFTAATTGAGTTTYSATGTNPDGSAATVTTSAVLDAACTVAAVGGTGATGATGGTGTSGTGLPFTGFAAGAAGVLGLGLVGGGTVLIVASRRRRQTEINS
jgi:hypothetical protein